MLKPFLRLIPKTRRTRRILGIGLLLVLVAVGTGVGVRKYRKWRNRPVPLPAEVEPNDGPFTFHEVRVPCKLAAALGSEGDVDRFRFTVPAGRHVGARLKLPEGSRMAALLTVTDAAGNVVQEVNGTTIGLRGETEGDYVLSVRDLVYRGGEGWDYQLEIGEIPVVHAVYPLGLQRGTERTFEVYGAGLGDLKTVTFQASPDAEPGARLPLPIPGLEGDAAGRAEVVAGEFPEVIRPEKANDDTLAGALPLPVPGTANGRLAQPGQVHLWRFSAQKGQRLVLEVEALRAGSLLDSSIEVLDREGRSIPRATLQCLAKTATTGFAGKKSTAPQLKLERNDDLELGDYVFIEGELVRVRHIESDEESATFRFFPFAADKQRVGYLDTTARFLSIGMPAYKVAIHPPGAELPANGLPQFTLPFANDDGGPYYGKDSRLFFDPPADGDYLVRITDARGEGGRDHTYRLTVRPPRPDYRLMVKPKSPKVCRGGGLPLEVKVQRIDGYDGPIDIHFEDVPTGLSVPAACIAAADETAMVALCADADAPELAEGARIKVIGRATVGGKETVREARCGPVELAEPADVAVRAKCQEIVLPAGGAATLDVEIERRNGFEGDVYLEIHGLPPGVSIQNFGMDTILFPPGHTTKTLTFAARANLAPIAQPIVLAAKEKDQKAKVEHAGRPVRMRVGPAGAR